MIVFRKTLENEPNNYFDEDAVTIRVGHSKRQKAWNDDKGYKEVRFVCSLRIRGMFIK